MATEMARTSRLRLDDIVVVDADVHAHETPGALAPYCDMPWRRSLELLADVPERYLDIPGFAPKLNLDPPFPGGFNMRTVTSAAQMRDELAALSIDIGILFPDNLLGMAQIPREDYAAALARAYNRWLLEEWLSREPSLYGALIAAPQDPADAAREIERYGADPRVVAVYLPTSAVSPLWGHRKYDPIFAAAEQAGLPVMLHSVSAVFPVFPFNIEQFDTALARHTISHTFAMMANLVSMVTTGVPVRFPRLKIVFTEAGISWVPFMMWRLDKEYNESRREVPFLEDKPSTYIKRMYFATQPVEEPDDPHDLVAMLRLFNGENQVLFASDWPHHDFDHPRQVFDLPLSPEARRKIMGANALQLFGIPTPARYSAGDAG
ncbi:MAG TPA: amidohydrolase family protein [Chloroflexota bacterium]|nr:amidohydrolase family protein [Chloroflexota bacterium]